MFNIEEFLFHLSFSSITNTFFLFKNLVVEHQTLRAWIQDTSRLQRGGSLYQEKQATGGFDVNNTRHCSCIGGLSQWVRYQSLYMHYGIIERTIKNFIYSSRWESRYQNSEHSDHRGLRDRLYTLFLCNVIWLINYSGLSFPQCSVLSQSNYHADQLLIHPIQYYFLICTYMQRGKNIFISQPNRCEK